MSCSNLDSNEDVRLNERDCEESEESADEIDNVLVNPDIYLARNIKIQRSKQKVCKTSLTRYTKESQLNTGGGTWSTPATTHVQRFVSKVLPEWWY
ncbi:hypothetical protein TNCV_4785391 [Trichonephila clavipes]|nr:hypothetical protein TNCV_4785391 [Trichonephila clavipes]